MTNVDYQLEQHFISVAKRPGRKHEDTITTFNRDIFWYDRDEVNRQLSKPVTSTKVTYEDHRKVVETAVNILGNNTQHDIAMCILTHRFFADYRALVFAGEGSFTTDYASIIKRISMLFNPVAGRVNVFNIGSRLSEYKVPTLVQINHITGSVKEVQPPSTKFTLNEWAIKYTEQANQSTTYRVAGLQVA